MSSTSSIPVDAAAREQIRSQLDVNLCVEAGAGTGKTSSLVSRIVELIATGLADADSIAVITFTEKAAAELSSRVREKLGEAAETETDPDRRAKLVAARKSLYRAHIETIHAFATSLLRERPIEARLDPEFEVLSGLEKDLDFAARYDEWLDGLLDSGDEAVARVLNLGMELDDIRKVAQEIDDRRFLLPLAHFDVPDVDVERFTEEVGAVVNELVQLAHGCTNEDDKACKNVRSASALLERLTQSGESIPARERAVLKLGYKAAGKTMAGNKANWADPDGHQRVRELCIELGEDLEAFQSDLRSAALLGVLPRIEEFVAGYRDRRLSDGRPDFDDLLIWARDLLRDRLEVRKYFQERYSHLLIDEFQDTDPIQVEIAMLLTSDGQDSTNWRELEPTAGKLFVVGDPKQSIYRFRRADIGIYDEVKRNVLSAGLLHIVQNFRSVNGIIDWVNATFDRLLIEEPGVQPSYEALKPVGLSLPDVDRPPVIVLHGGSEEMDAGALRDAEADGIAALLHQALEEEHWPVRDRHTGEWRPANWGDVAILMPTRSGLDSYEQSLGAAGIPHRHAGARDYFQRQEVRDLIHILRAIDDPGDGYSVVGALRSSAFGCSDADLAIHRGGDGEQRGYWSFSGSQESESPQVALAFEVLADLSRARRQLSLAELVRMVVERSNMVEFALTLPDGPQAAANLLAIGEQAQSFSSAGGGGLRSFTRWLDQSTKVESQEVDAGIVEEADEVVRLMTIHGAKGLEFPIVVLGNLAAKGRSQKGPVVEEETRHLHLQTGVAKRGYLSTPSYDERWDDEKAAQDAELLRLLYVASTRARDHLIVPYFRGKRTESAAPLAKLVDALPAVEHLGHEIAVEHAWVLDARELGTVEVEAPSETRASEQDVERALESRSGWGEQKNTLIKGARKGIAFTVASSVERSATPMTSEASSSSAALLLSEGPPIPIGDALHLVMEKVTLPGADDLDEVAAAVCVDGGLDDHLDEVRELARRCLLSPTVRLAIESGTYQREVPFTTQGEDGGITTGRTDLVFRIGDDYVVVDYKTDSVEAASVGVHTLEQHAGQAFAYRTGLGTAVPVERTVFVYCRADAEVTLRTASIDEPPRIGEVTASTGNYAAWTRRADGKIVSGGEDATWADAEDSEEGLRRFNVEGIDPGA